MKYYIAVDGRHQGPFEVEQLTAQGITPSTLVWNESLTGWTPAGEIDEIVEACFAAGEPQPQPEEPQPVFAPEGYTPGYDAPAFNGPAEHYAPEMPQTWLVPAILITICCCAPCGLVSLVYAIKVESRYNCGLYDKALQASSTARLWFIIGLVAGVLFWIGYGAYMSYIVSHMAGMMSAFSDMGF